MNEPKTPPLEPWLLPDGHLPAKPVKTLLSVINGAKGGQTPPESPESTETPETSQRERRSWLDNVDDGDRSSAVQNLLQTARGASLILWSICEKADEEACDLNGIVSGLSFALKTAADDVDATYFGSAGELAETLKPRILAELLEKKLKKLRAKMAEEGE